MTGPDLPPDIGPAPTATDPRPSVPGPSVRQSGPPRTAAARWGGLIIVIAAVLGAGQGWLWAVLSPGTVYLVYPDGQFLALPTASASRYTPVGLFALMGLVVGVELAVAAWQVRRARGSVTLLIVTGAAAIGATVAYLLGQALAGGIDPASIGATGGQRLVTAGPVHSALAIIIEPALAAAVYTFLAAWNGSPVLGRPARDLPTPTSLTPSELPPLA